MTFFRIAVGALLAACHAAMNPSALALQAGQISPAGLVGEIDGQPTQYVVLGTSHLSAAEGFDPAWLTPLLDRLESWAPDVIVVESLPGWQIETLQARSAEYPDVAATFGRTALAMAEAVSLEPRPLRREALAEAMQIAESDPDPSDRRRAIALFAAALEPDSAALQWSYLDPAERQPGNGVSAGLADQLDMRLSSMNERTTIGIALARRLNLARLHSLDDHQDKDLFLDSVFQEELSNHVPALMQSEALQAFLETQDFSFDGPGSVMEIYRWMNSPAYRELDVRGQWLSFLALPSNGLGRDRVAMWEIRNLGMASNARRAAIGRPGARILIIVGAAHRPWLEDYLSRMTDVEIVPSESLLGN
ncbi:DUF5694 domain-containing protein [Hyphobacterium sp. HN65]|uniref:DUF5694 domain-containing protein n=1 Tax=Hyphobacterium lacteum TaxID=3116575 RepID=A0ABU7LRH9_9PROT|nr:DUF5694 domain-containing protein [Hyphobacterium sp. HN65]MEE2526508.1 DUF5694 domain-containing protein [Hyphobacterium sp. HN65]